MTDPRQWHGYAYSHHNPATFSDPTGLIDTDCLTVRSCPDYRMGDEKGNRKNRAKDRKGCWPRCAGSRDMTLPRHRTGPNPNNKPPTALKDGPGANAEAESTADGVPVYQAGWCGGMPGYNCILAFRLSEQAKERATRLKGQKNWIFGERNAFRHSYWMALMTANGFSVEEALALGAAHELDGDKPGEMLGSEESNADLHNNEVGARIGAKVMSNWNYVAPVGASSSAEQKIEARLLAMLDGYKPTMGPYTRSTRDGNLRMIPPKR
ncbi:DUF6973 domain-containing protein [Micromonospora chalcea]